MKDFDALKDIWHGQISKPRAGYDEILKQVKASGSSFARKLLLETMAMTGMILIFLLIWAYNPFLMWTTHLSLLIFIGACLYYIFVQYSGYRSISNSEALLRQPEEYIAYLKVYKRDRYILNTRKYAFYSIFIGLAFALYFIEVYFTSPLWQTILGIIFTISWFIACGFFMRIYIKREQDRLQDMIENLERIQKQFEE